MSAEALTQSAQEAIRLAEKATPGPWEKDEVYAVPFPYFTVESDAPDTGHISEVECINETDADFIAVARTLVPSQARIILSLVETIKSAPHEPNCCIKYIETRQCTCWKATAFADAMKGE